MQKFFFTRPGKSIKSATLLIFIQVACFSGIAQSYIGYHSSAYAGVYGIITSPADILNHRVRGDLNLVGISTGIGNNTIKFNYKKRNDDNGGVTFPEPIKKNGKLNFNTDVLGPSVLIRLSDKNAIAITTRARLFTNIHDISTGILNSELPDTIRSQFLGTTLLNSNMSVNMHGWKEVALTYSRQIANTDFGVWKAGVSVKYLGGIAAVSLSTSKFSFIHDSIVDPIDNKKKDALINAQGSIILGYTKNIDSLSGNDFTSFKNKGLGLDVGVSYEFRDEMQVYETQYSDRTANYIWKVGASITDIGFIRYSRQQTKGIVTNFNGNTYTIDQLSLPSDSTDVYQIANYYKNLFNANTTPPEFTMQLPTTLHLTYDRNFNKWLGVQGQLNMPLVFSKLSRYTGSYNPVAVFVTPRAEIPLGGLYLPVSYNSVSGFQAGAALRLGPLVIGSSSIINSRVLGKTKTADVYFILRVPLFGYREYKNKTYNQENPKLTKKQRKALDCPK
jgi:Family of unknown function (DUF5723)